MLNEGNGGIRGMSIRRDLRYQFFNNDFLCLRALRTLNDGERYPVAFVKMALALFTYYGAVMHEDVAAQVPRDEAVALIDIEPFDRTGLLL